MGGRVHVLYLPYRLNQNKTIYIQINTLQKVII